ncbi:Glutamate-gated chloride channel [Hypsibius exemplaris]|uniref:Glutamate-gated chloride channel n=1 Tax=Hypsibius exemplaris TaxID=2072580 RepID=A0A9X6NIP0_HYPEX|nr:Glutamate-gated chloride channel [Hypsibius exemplaris]
MAREETTETRHVHTAVRQYVRDVRPYDNYKIHGKPHATKGTVLSHLLSHYDKTVLPSSHGGNEGLPTTVKVNLLIRDGSLNDDKTEFSTTVTLRMNWTDQRLAYHGSSKHPYLPVHDGHHLWTPDIFFNNEKSAHFHHVLTPNVLYKIYPDGTVFMSSRLSLVLGCPMDFTWFPFDRQTCQIKLSSYGHTTSEVALMWKEQNPVENFNFTAGKHVIEAIQYGQKVSPTSSGDYVILTVDLTFQRLLSSYVSHYFLPTVVMVMITWLAFWIHPDMVTPRILLSVLSLLTVYHLQTGPLSGSFPTATALTLWGEICVAFIVLALLETVLANFWNRKDSSVSAAASKGADELAGTPLLFAAFGEKNGQPATRGERVDAICRMAFPLLFTLVSAAYWSVCLLI